MLARVKATAIARFSLVVLAVGCGQILESDDDDEPLDPTCELDTVWREPAGGQPFAAVNSGVTEWAGEISDDGRTVVFTSDRTNGFRLWLATRGERDQAFAQASALNLTTDTTDDRDPSFNGQELYFLTKRGPLQCVHVSKHAGGVFGPARQLDICADVGGGELAALYVSRDGLRLYYENNGQVTMSARGTTTVDFAKGAAVVGLPSDLHFCALSGDELTVYCERTTSAQVAELWQAQRVTLTSPFGNAAPVSGFVEPRSVSDPSVTPDGKLMLYAARAANAAPELHLVERVCR